MHYDFNHTGFSWSTMTPFDNGKWTEGDAAGGVAWVGVVAAQSLTPADPHLAMAKAALGYLEAQTESPLYECVMPLGVLAAARMNAQHGTNYSVGTFLEWSLSGGHNQHRQGWGEPRPGPLCPPWNTCCAQSVVLGHGVASAAVQTINA